MDNRPFRWSIRDNSRITAPLTSFLVTKCVRRTDSADQKFRRTEHIPVLSHLPVASGLAIYLANDRRAASVVVIGAGMAGHILYLQDGFQIVRILILSIDKGSLFRRMLLPYWDIRTNDEGVPRADRLLLLAISNASFSPETGIDKEDVIIPGTTAKYDRSETGLKLLRMPTELKSPRISVSELAWHGQSAQEPGSVMANVGITDATLRCFSLLISDLPLGPFAPNALDNAMSTSEIEYKEAFLLDLSQSSLSTHLEVTLIMMKFSSTAALIVLATQFSPESSLETILRRPQRIWPTC
ncbi:hypothetical protein BT96DRAFT_1004785 [Gymnopus androsaceus JB14]|uniref:Uncharacterized protein n=1 Tax=Gymnopus androsaceus JB14 TaxID=1447944 RepID=A0A6A4GQA6_9AGAR|nr:hypothetical protein BT96DRAFT_1004785 [Gymnopus androsaceus JB14]